MSALAVQTVVLALIGAAGVIMAFRRLLPGTTRRLQSAAARYFLKPERALRWQAFGRWLQPAESVSGACGSGGGTGCGSCGGCGSATTTSTDAQPLVFHRKPRAQS